MTPAELRANMIAQGVLKPRDKRTGRCRNCQSTAEECRVAKLHPQLGACCLGCRDGVVHHEGERCGPRPLAKCGGCVHALERGERLYANGYGDEVDWS